jgi:hypothetical protein
MNSVQEDKRLTPKKTNPSDEISLENQLDTQKGNNEVVVPNNQSKKSQHTDRPTESASSVKEASPDALVTSKVTPAITPSEGIKTEVFASKADDTSSPIEFSTSENSSVLENNNVNAVSNDHRINEELKTPVDTSDLQELDKPRNFESSEASTISDKMNSIEPGNEELSKNNSFSRANDAKKESGLQNQSTSADIDLTSSHKTEPSSASPNKENSITTSGRASNDPREVRKRQSKANQSEKDQ